MGIIILHGDTGCVTPQQVSNVQDMIDGDYDMLDGFEDLTDEDQSRVRQAIENGHIADEDCVSMVSIYMRSRPCCHN